VDLTTSKHLWVEDGLPVADSNIVSCSRIGIARAGEWTHKPLRYYIFGNQCVSKRDKKAEELADLV
jgi:DNA-3-methyladenine glycosylase